MILYFDTNIFDCIQQRRGLTEWDAYRLQKAIVHGYGSIVLSFLNIEETLFLIETQPDRARARIRLMLEMTDHRLFVLSQDIVLQNDILSYARDKPLLSPFSIFTPQMELIARNLAHPSGPVLADLKDILTETRAAKATFQSGFEEGRREVLPLAKKIGGKNYKFETYCENNATWVIESFAQTAGVLKEVRERGLSGLLKLKSVGLAVGVNLSLMYSHHFENRTPRPGDSRDVLHALLGSCADVFVTDDSEFRRNLQRVPVPNFQAVSIQELIAMLPAWI